MADVKEQLVNTAVRLLAESGPTALTARRLTAELGLSTMAIYTHVGGMDELRAAVRVEGFERLAQRWAAIGATDDSVADLTVAGGAYTLFALSEPNLFRLMFFDVPANAGALPVYDVQLRIVERCVADGRFRPADPLLLTTQLWAVTHGIVSGLLGGVIDVAGALEIVRALGETLYVGLGDDPAAARRSIAAAERRVAAGD